MENKTLSGSADEVSGKINPGWLQVLSILLASVAVGAFLIFYLRSQIYRLTDSPDYLTQKDSERFTIGLNFAQVCNLLPEKPEVNAFVLETADQNSKSGFCEIILEDTSGNTIRLSFKDGSLVKKDFKWLMSSRENRLNLLRLQSLNELAQALSEQKKRLFPPQEALRGNSMKKI